jgi:lipopolysaccharide export LptBFGC system permease protein LptF
MKAFGGRLDRYLAGRMLVITVMVTLLMIIITMAIDFLINVGSLKPTSLSQSWLIASLYWYKLPQLANLALPVSAVIAAILVCAPMLKRGEFVALSACGISPGRVALFLPLVALGVGCVDAYIADRMTPLASIETIEIQDRLLNQHRTGRVWEVPSTRTSWFVGSEQLLTGTVPSMHIIVIASARGLVMADAMLWVKEHWVLNGHLLDFRVNTDGTTDLQRPSEIALTGDLALPYGPHELFARLLPRDTMTGNQLIHLRDRSDVAYAWTRWAHCIFPFLAVLIALPVFVRFAHRDNLILGVARALGAAAVPVLIVVVGNMAGESLPPQWAISAAVALALVPCLVVYRRWRL